MKKHLQWLLAIALVCVPFFAAHAARGPGNQDFEKKEESMKRDFSLKAEDIPTYAEISEGSYSKEDKDNPDKTEPLLPEKVKLAIQFANAVEQNPNAFFDEDCKEKTERIVDALAEKLRGTEFFDLWRQAADDIYGNGREYVGPLACAKTVSRIRDRFLQLVEQKYGPDVAQDLRIGYDAGVSNTRKKIMDNIRKNTGTNNHWKVIDGTRRQAGRGQQEGD